MYWINKKEETEKFLYLVMKKIPFIVYDIETTGLKSKSDWIVQFSANRYEIVNGIYQLVDSLNEYIKPPIIMSQDVVDVHGITNEFLENKPTESEVFDKIKNFLDFENSVLCGYNTDRFDCKFMASMYERNESEFNPISTVDIYKVVKENVCPRQMEDFSLSLSNMSKMLKIDDQINFHSASDDIIATWMIGVAMLKQYKAQAKISKLKDCQFEIISMNHYKKSNTVNRIYFEIKGSSFGYGRLFYDIRTKWWCDVADDSTIIDKINMEDLCNLADLIVKQCGFKKLDDFDGTYRYSQEVQNAG